jgi:deferrochelatase/peroxidase EfeB
VETFRIFRQGYPYLEPHPTEAFRVGLNFVSFQNSPQRLIGMLTSDTWLGGTNFGGLGEGAPPDIQLLTAYAAGMFFVPPVATHDRFPGYRLLSD